MHISTEGEAAVPVEFRRLAGEMFGETEENMDRLMGELREAIKEEGLLIPGKDGEYTVVDCLTKLEG